jgi:uncharacterized protein with GYD domain
LTLPGKRRGADKCRAAKQFLWTQATRMIVAPESLSFATTRSTQMPHFMVSCNYSAEAKNAMIANPVDRTKAASAAVEAVGGKLHSAFMTFGETDIIVIYEAPDAIASAALAMTLGASGGFSSIKTTALLTTADAIKALKLSAETKAAYKPPSK